MSQINIPPKNISGNGISASSRFSYTFKRVFENLKTSLLPKYAFIISVITLVAVTLGLLIMRWMKMKMYTSKTAELEIHIKKCIDESKHNLTLAKQDADPDLKKDHIVQSRTLLTVAKEMSDGNVNLNLLTNIDYNNMMNEINKVKSSQ